MHHDVKAKTPSLAGGSELLVMAPIKQGFVPTLDSVTYKSRVKAVLRLLHVGRRGQHEYSLLRAISDAAERVGVIHTLRVLVVEGDHEAADKVLLSVSFDGSYEAYVRVIWQKAARLLDLIFCNTVDYPTGWDHSYDEWSSWLRSVQVETPFFYATPGLTFQDQTYLRMLERRDRGLPDHELQRTQIVTPRAEEIAWRVGANKVDPTDWPNEDTPKYNLPTRASIRQGLQGLAGIYRLSDYYREGTADGAVLKRAAQELLPELKDMLDPFHQETFGQTIKVVSSEQFVKQLSWFEAGRTEPLPAVRQAPKLADLPLSLPSAEIQAGILQPLPGIAAGCLCLIGFANAAAAAAFLEAASPATESDTVAPDSVVLNLALTAEGLRACGLEDGQLDWFPLEFRQGMSVRAGLLGDVRGNHPRRWDLPRMNGAAAMNSPGSDGPAGAPFVTLDRVHAIIQLRVAPSEETWRKGATETLLAQRLEALAKAAEGIEILHVQWLKRHLDGATFIDHFGFTDGQSQPEILKDPQTPRFPNRVHAGEVLIGHDNAADHEGDLWINAEKERQDLFRNGTFIVIRKLRQNVAELDDAVKQLQQDTGIPTETTLAKMMGRWPANSASGMGGKPLVTLGPGGLNDFNYSFDPDGEKCPLGAHIRRANPRSLPPEQDAFPKLPPGQRAPRIVRRSMPYGPALTAQSIDADRGLLFMCYCASIAEQFEVIQRWLAGGNSSGTYSGSACPFLGVPEVGRRRNFRFEEGRKTYHLWADGSDDLGEEPEQIVRLLWGLYGFVPSETARNYLIRRAQETNQAGVAIQPWSARDGLQEIDRLRRIEADSGAAAATLAWKAALEDPESIRDNVAASIWAAIRQHHGGVLGVPYGVLVASPQLVNAVLVDAQQRYTAQGYQDRLKRAIGPIYLGMDASDPDYKRLSAVANAETMKLSQADGFDAAFAATQSRLQELVEHAKWVDNDDGVREWELAVDLRGLIEGTLAVLCEQWFGLTSDPENGPFRRGGIDLGWQSGQPVPYPGHFTATSRATFQPLPSPTAESLSEDHGAGLRKAMLTFLTAHHDTLGASTITRKVVDALWASCPDEAARTVTGVMMGFLPTTEGILRRVLVEWTQDGTLMALKAMAAAASMRDAGQAIDLIGRELRRTMMLRPVPEQIWRTATSAHELGADPLQRVQVRPGDKIILALVSATHAVLESATGQNVFPVFGGNREAVTPATHACPGYNAAMGVLTGVIAALLDVDAELRTGPPPGALLYSGLFSSAPKRRRPGAGALGLVKPSDKGELLGFGDSWFYNAFAPSNSSHFQEQLKALGWDTKTFKVEDYCRGAQRLADMAAIQPGTGIYALVEDLVADWKAGRGALPRAILLGGGGNDVKDGGTSCIWPSCDPQGTGSPLDGLVEGKGSTPPLNVDALNRFLNSMVDHLSVICRRLAASATSDGKQMIPIVVHGYDFPYPDGRPSALLLCPSLAPTFTRTGFRRPVGGNPMADGGAIAVMESLITELNRRYALAVDALHDNQGVDVRFKRLAGTLQSQADFNTNPAGYKKYWANELHPTTLGFKVLAAALSAELMNLPQPVGP